MSTARDKVILLLDQRGSAALIGSLEKSDISGLLTALTDEIKTTVLEYKSAPKNLTTRVSITEEDDEPVYRFSPSSETEDKTPVTIPSDAQQLTEDYINYLYAAGFTKFEIPSHFLVDFDFIRNILATVKTVPVSQVARCPQVKQFLQDSYYDIFQNDPVVRFKAMARKRLTTQEKAAFAHSCITNLDDLTRETEDSVVASTFTKALEIYDTQFPSVQINLDKIFHFLAGLPKELKEISMTSPIINQFDEYLKNLNSSISKSISNINSPEKAFLAQYIMLAVNAAEESEKNKLFSELFYGVFVPLFKSGNIIIDLFRRLQDDGPDLSTKLDQFRLALENGDLDPRIKHLLLELAEQELILTSEKIDETVEQHTKESLLNLAEQNRVAALKTLMPVKEELKEDKDSSLVAVEEAYQQRLFDLARGQEAKQRICPMISEFETKALLQREELNKLSSTKINAMQRRLEILERSHKDRVDRVAEIKGLTAKYTLTDPDITRVQAQLKSTSETARQTIITKIETLLKSEDSRIADVIRTWITAHIDTLRNARNKNELLSREVGKEIEKVKSQIISIVTDEQRNLTCQINHIITSNNFDVLALRARELITVESEVSESMLQQAKDNEAIKKAQEEIENIKKESEDEVLEEKGSDEINESSETLFSTTTNPGFFKEFCDKNWDDVNTGGNGLDEVVIATGKESKVANNAGIFTHSATATRSVSSTSSSAANLPPFPFKLTPEIGKRLRDELTATQKVLKVQPEYLVRRQIGVLSCILKLPDDMDFAKAVLLALSNTQSSLYKCLRNKNTETGVLLTKTAYDRVRKCLKDKRKGLSGFTTFTAMRSVFRAHEVSCIEAGKRAASVVTKKY